MRQKRTVRASSVRANASVLWRRAICRSLWWGVGWPSLYRQSTQQASSLSGQSPGHMDSRADDSQRGTLARRLERGRGRRYAATKHRCSRLRGGVPRRGSSACSLVLQNDTTRSLTHATEPSPLYSPECVEGEFCEVGLPLYGVLRSSLPRMATWHMERL